MIADRRHQRVSEPLKEVIPAPIELFPHVR